MIICLYKNKYMRNYFNTQAVRQIFFLAYAFKKDLHETKNAPHNSKEHSQKCILVFRLKRRKRLAICQLIDDSPQRLHPFHFDAGPIFIGEVMLIAIGQLIAIGMIAELLEG